MTSISMEDSIDDENGIPPRFGYPHKVKITLENAGEWKVLPNGDRLWHLTITCPGAKSINLLYDKYWLPEGAKLFVYSNDNRHSIGAFTSTNNKGTKDNLRGFASGLIYSDTVVVDYSEPKDVSYNGVISISHVVQGYRYININRDYGGSGSCQVNVNCPEGQAWQNEKNAVALVLVNGYRYCTGSLINTTANDNSPLFLTANHCLRGWANNDTMYDAITKPNLDHYSFWWHYETPGCSNTVNEPSHHLTTGATVVANNVASDFALLLLTEDPKNDTEITPYYLGWDNSGNPGTGGVGIHHPSVDVKKISTYTIQPTSTNNMVSAPNVYGLFWRVVWSATTNGYGTTEGGSSGSPLLNNSHRVIGQLSTGKSECGKNDFPDWYGKFSASWTGYNATDYRRKLQPWLDSSNTGATTHDGVGLVNDLYVRDTVTDDGSMPSNEYRTWDSPDIWVEDMDGNVVDNPQGNTSYKVCVCIHNRRDVASSGTEKLFLNWAKAGFNDQWYEYWTSYHQLPCGAYKGGTIGNPNGNPLPVISANGSYVTKIDWVSPAGEDYANCTDFNYDNWHFCLLARIHDGNIIAHENEQLTDVHPMVRNHNNVAQRNIYFYKSGEKNQSTSGFGNNRGIATNRIICLSPKVIGNISITDYAEVYITLDAGLLTAINNANISGLTWVNSNTLRWNGGSACIPVTLPANSYYTLQTTVHFIADQLPEETTFDFDIVLRDPNAENILGGEHFRCIRTGNRYFQAVANNGSDDIYGSPAELTAEDINEPADYRWYDNQGVEGGSGTSCYVNPQQTTTYTLRVTAEEDGYRSYDQVTVNVAMMRICSVSPNPAEGQARVSYELSRSVSAATLQILNGSGQVVHSQVLSGGNGSKVTGEAVVNTSSLAAGSYTVRLVSSNGKVHDSRTLVVR